MTQRNGLIIALLLLIVLLAGMGCGALDCPMHSTWSVDCYTMGGRFETHATGNGCNCVCPLLTIARNCHVSK